MYHMYNLNLFKLGLTTRLRYLSIKIKTKYNIYLLNVTQKKFIKILNTLKSTPNVKSKFKSILRGGGGGGGGGVRTAMRKKRKKKNKKKFVCYIS